MAGFYKDDEDLDEGFGESLSAAARKRAAPEQAVTAKDRIGAAITESKKGAMGGMGGGWQGAVIGGIGGGIKGAANAKPGDSEAIKAEVKDVGMASIGIPRDDFSKGLGGMGKEKPKPEVDENGIAWTEDSLGGKQSEMGDFDVPEGGAAAPDGVDLNDLSDEDWDAMLA